MTISPVMVPLSAPSSVTVVSGTDTMSSSFSGMTSGSGKATTSMPPAEKAKLTSGSVPTTTPTPIAY